MNAENMTREEFEEFLHDYVTAPDPNKRIEFWNRFDAIQNRPFQPDWSLSPPNTCGFVGHFTDRPEDSWRSVGLNDAEFYIPAPHNPTDAELVAMFDKLDLDKKLEVLRDAGVVV
jgi:hypothetical protein